MVPALRATAEQALDRGASDAGWASRVVGLVVLATAYWILVAFPLIGGLLALD